MGLHGKKRKKENEKESMISIWMGEALMAWTEASKARTEAYKRKVRERSVEVSNGNEFTIEKCIDALNTLGDIDNNLYVTALTSFKDGDNREIFMRIDDDKKIAWLNSFIHASGNEFTIAKCIDSLNTYGDLDDEVYGKALESFKDADNRKIFMKIDDGKKIAWLKSLV
ncbi:hypothetical protein CFOL_v3_27270 [Cephalotus follicularis]|uniref:Uncharacterized protein n=1 Tax=Cephalotus follicularis TaxID=3775 RepID=A0A1Q3CUI6_CEPFO|nr:hypothetical protein CFOL_v3_27270 [Cephalotus follicularis]